jgi:hypothetical protein
MKLRVEKVHSFSTLPIIATIATSTIFRKPLLQSHVGCKTLPPSSDGIVIMRRFHDIFII